MDPEFSKHLESMGINGARTPMESSEDWRFFGGVAKVPMEFAAQSSFAASVRPRGCGAVFHHSRSVGNMFLCGILDRSVIDTAKVHKRNTSELKPVNTSSKKVRARNLE